MRADVVDILSQVFRVPAESLEESSSPDSIATWDSLSHLEMIAALESRFGLRFNMREIQTMDTPERIEAVLDTHEC
ncbi:MAG: acyl carrier protein [Planctomycetes bacterium]|nr:acyl carrier protein [Planctomycetota bacterium]